MRERERERWGKRRRIWRIREVREGEVKKKKREREKGGVRGR